MPYKNLEDASKADAARYRRNKEKLNNGARKVQLQKKYGLSLEDYDAMLEKQNGVCAICGGVNESGKRLAVDHNHETGKVRGLLCYKCNTGLGVLKDSIKIVKAALDYLIEYDD